MTVLADADADAAGGSEPVPPPRRVAHADMESPVELPTDEQSRTRPLAWTTTVIAVATLFLFLTNAVSLNGWAAELPPSALSARLIAATQAWEDVTGRIGLGAPRAAVHGAWKKAEAARFGGGEGTAPAQ